VVAAIGYVETVQPNLGQACLDHGKPYLTVDQAAIRWVFESPFFIRQIRGEAILWHSLLK